MNISKDHESRNEISSHLRRKEFVQIVHSGPTQYPQGYSHLLGKILTEERVVIGIHALVMRLRSLVLMKMLVAIEPVLASLLCPDYLYCYPRREAVTEAFARVMKARKPLSWSRSWYCWGRAKEGS